MLRLHGIDIYVLEDLEEAVAAGASHAASLRGALDLMVLGVLAESPLHGYAIAQTIHDRAGRGLKVEEGSLYPALYRMEEKGWVRASWGRNDNNRRVRVYTITAAGKRRLDHERAAWASFADAVGRVVRVGRS